MNLNTLIEENEHDIVIEIKQEKIYKMPFL